MKLRLFTVLFLGFLYGCIGSPEPRNPMKRSAAVAEVDSATVAPVETPTNPGDIPLDPNPQPGEDGKRFY